MFFDKWTKKVATKATDGDVEGVKESLNDKLETYSGIIKIGLTLDVIIFGSKKINDHAKMQRQQPQHQEYLYGYEYPMQRQQPIIINNYITDGRTHSYGGQKQNNRKH